MGESYTKIADQAGVSLSTVSRVIRGLKGPSSATREHVLAVAQRLGVDQGSPEILLLIDRTNVRGRSLRTDPFYGLVLEGIDERARELGLRVATVRSPHDTSQYGVLFVGHSDSELLSDLAQARVPVVLVDEDDPRFDRVISQNRRGGALAASHLLERVPAHLGIALISGSPAHYSYTRRLAGAVDMLERAGRFDPALVYAPHLDVGEGDGRDRLSGRRAAHWLLEVRGQVGGVFVYNDAAALELLSELELHGLPCPAALRVMGFDDDAEAGHARVPLSSVRVDHRGMGRWAIDLLVKRLAEPAAAPVQVAVAVDLVIRESTA